MTRTTHKLLMGYGAFCAVNWAATYYAARSGSPRLLGSAQLLTLNESLRPLNLLARLIDPRSVAHAPAAHTPAGAPPQQFLPDAATVTHYASGTTTTFQP